MYTTRDDIIAANAIELNMSKSKVSRAMDALIMADLAWWGEGKDGAEFHVKAGTKNQFVLGRL